MNERLHDRIKPDQPKSGSACHMTRVTAVIQLLFKIDGRIPDLGRVVPTFINDLNVKKM